MRTDAVVSTPEGSLQIAVWLHVIFNIFEAIAWFVSAVVVFARCKRTRESGIVLLGTDRRVAKVAGVAFVLFGASDVWELFTGTWYRPLSLLLLNIACASVLSACLGYMIVRRRTGRGAKPGERGSDAERR